MICEIIAAVLLPAIILYYYKQAYIRPKNFPPGPPSLPVYGAYWIVLSKEMKNLAVAFCKLGEQYKTKILGMYLAIFPVVILNDPVLIKEMLNREEFDGRLDIILTRLRSYWKRLGIFFTDGYYWHVQRRFSLRYLRDYGFGRRDESLEDTIAHEIKEMLDMRINGPKYPAEKEIVKGELVYLPDYFAAPFLNGILHVYSRTVLPRSEYHALWQLSRGSLMFLSNSDDLGGALSLTPWLKDILPNWSGYNALRKGNQYLLDFFTELIDNTMATHDETHERHFLDVYITKMKQEIKTKERSTFSVQQLILTCTDYMLPSASIVESVLSMLIERMLLQPEVQDKIHEEIDRVVGRDRLPTLDDRKNMPYTEACLRELMRMESPVPLGVPHRTMSDTTLGGYDIPENTLVATNFITLHMNKTIWNDPENFRPERFIVDGQLNVASDKSLPFGAGRRLCAGETYARNTMFQVLSAFMQAFYVSTPDGRPIKKLSKRIQGIITTIPGAWVRVTPRN